MNKTELRIVKEFEANIPTSNVSFKEIAAKSNILLEEKKTSFNWAKTFGIAFASLATIALAIAIPTAFKNAEQAKNDITVTSYRYSVGTFCCIEETLIKENTKFSFKDASIKIEESDASPKAGQLSTPGKDLLNSGLLITFSGCVIENVVFGEAEEKYPNIYDSLTYGFELDSKEYKINIYTYSNESPKDLRVSIYEPSDSDEYGDHDYVIVGRFSLDGANSN